MEEDQEEPTEIVHLKQSLSEPTFWRNEETDENIRFKANGIKGYCHVFVEFFKTKY